MIEIILLVLGAIVVLWPSKRKSEYVIDDTTVVPNNTPTFEASVAGLNAVRRRIEDTDEWDTDETEAIMLLMHALVRGSDK